MRRVAWMLFVGWIVGCGTASQSIVAVKDADEQGIVVPAEVQSLFNRGEHAQAIDVLNAMIDKHPRDEKLYSLRSTAHHQLGHYVQAIADLDRAIAINDKDAKLFNNRGFIRMGLEQFDAAQSDFDRATELSDRFKNAYNNRGLLNIARQRYEEAIAQFNRAIELDPQYVDAYNNRGFAELESGRIEQSLDDFNLAIQLDGKYVNAYNNRGLLRARAGDFENSVIDFTHAMMLDPMNPKYYQHRREVYLRQGYIDKAIADEKKLTWLVQLHQLSANIAVASQPAMELTQRANHFMQVDDIDSALGDLDRAISLDSNSASAYAARATIHLRKKSISKAKSDAEAALTIAPAHEAYSVLGDVFLSLGDYDRAIENFAHARRVDPSVAEAYYAKSKELAEKGEVQRARQTLQQALVLDPDVESRLR